MTTREETLNIKQITDLIEYASINEYGHASFGLNDTDRKTLVAFLRVALSSPDDDVIDNLEGEVSDAVYEFLERRALTADQHAQDLMYEFGLYLAEHGLRNHIQQGSDKQGRE